jgi:hypothetical protein
MTIVSEVNETVNKANKAVQNLTKTTYEVSQTITRSTVAAQERNIRFSQKVLENGIDALKGHVETTRNLMQQVTQPQEPQKTFQVVIESAVASQRRNVEFAQHLVNGGEEVFKEHMEASRSLAQSLTEQAQEIQKAFPTLFAVKPQ